MKPWARDRGFTPEGAKLAEKALPFALEMFKVCPDLSSCIQVVEEAHFRLKELRKHTRKFQRRYRKENGL